MNVEHLIKQMTLQEKIGQLVQILPSVYSDDHEDIITGPVAQLMKESGITKENRWEIGSVIGINNAAQARDIQSKYLEHNRLQIPLLFMADIIHGHRTIYPVPLAMASSWDIEAIEQMARQSAFEAAVSGLHVTFSPMADLTRDARWGRVMEATGEDVWLNGEMAAAFVRGYQGTDLKNERTLAACVKHFAAYGAPEGGRDYNTVDMSDRELREFYLPAYKRALDEGAKLVMTSFNVVDGIPATVSTYLLRDILRKEWAFDGVTISDWSSIKEVIFHGVAESLADAGRLAMDAGVDIDMMSGAYLNHLEEVIEQKKISVTKLDEAVLRILRLKDELGLFEHPYRGIETMTEQAVHLSQEHRVHARELAEKSIVLLKNEDILPLSDQKIALIGPFITSTDVLGPWAGSGKTEEAIPLIQAFREKGTSFSYSPGSDVEEEIDWEAAVETARQAEVIVLALGEASWMSGEAGSKTDIRLPKTQVDGLKKLAALNIPIVTVLFNGRPLDLREVERYSTAILEAWYPGTETGHAVYNLLYGHQSPSAKLTMSFPHHVGQMPLRYDALRTGRPADIENADIRYTSKYLDAPNEALFPFGFGMSYAQFDYEQLTLSHRDCGHGDITATVKVSNTSTVEGDEIIQWYIQDQVAEVSRPVKQLRGFNRVTIAPGTSIEVELTISLDMLAYLHPDGSRRADDGYFTLFVGPSSTEGLSAEFALNRVVKEIQHEHDDEKTSTSAR